MTTRLLHIITALILVLSVGSAQVVWRKSQGTKTFTKAGNADWTLTANQDHITDSVWLTRASNQSIFNIRKESSYNTGSPVGTTWAFGTTDSFSLLTYKSFVSLSGNDPQSLIGKDLVLHLVAQNVYLDIKILTWTNGSGGASFSYIRADGILPVELTMFWAVPTQRSVRLQWRTATEVQNAGFAIERMRIPSSAAAIEGETASAWGRCGFVQGGGTRNAPQEYSFLDDALPSGRYRYRLQQIDHDGAFTYSPSIEVTVAAPGVFSLQQNYPNPFNPTTAISYQLSVSGVITLLVYDALGCQVAQLVNGVQEAGTYTVRFDGTHLASGVYFAHLTSSGMVRTRRMLLMK